MNWAAIIIACLAAVFILALIVLVIALYLALQDANDENEWLWTIVAEKEEELENTVERRFKRYADSIRERFDRFTAEVDEIHGEPE